MIVQIDVSKWLEKLEFEPEAVLRVITVVVRCQSKVEISEGQVSQSLARMGARSGRTHTGRMDSRALYGHTCADCMHGVSALLLQRRDVGCIVHAD